MVAVENGEELNQLRDFIASRTGLLFRTADTEKFASAIQERMRARSVQQLADYRHVLERNDDTSRAEWQHLGAALVPGESYFFRDAGQMRVLLHEVLPRLIARRRESGLRQLRLWSAGCSTGEEAYSLAALLFETLPDYRDWDVVLLGTDSNPEALHRARQARYSEWSFRQVAPERRERYFIKEAGLYRPLPEIQSLVEFQVHDLVTAEYPRPVGALHDLDLIVCRNVFIYMQPDVIQGIVSKMEASLRPGGCLLTGHGELSDARPRTLRTWLFSESIVYRKPLPGEEHPGAPQKEDLPQPAQLIHSSPGPPAPPEPAAPPAPAPATDGLPVLRPVQTAMPLQLIQVPDDAPVAPIAPEPPPDVGGSELSEVASRARAHLAAGAYGEAAALLLADLKRRPEQAELEYLLARVYANLGRLDEAGQLVQQVLRRQPSDEGGVRGYFLLAQLAEDRGDSVEAMELLKRTIYLDAAYLPGYLELGLLYEQNGDHERARRMLTSARDLLKGLAPETEIEEYNGETAALLLERVAASL